MNIFEVRKQILKDIIGDQKVSDFCRAHDITPAFISQILTGSRKMGDQAALNLEEKLRLPSGTIAMPQIDAALPEARVFFDAPLNISNWRTVRIMGTAQMGDNGYWYEFEDGDGCIDVISTDPDAYALRVRGDSMAPAIRNNWVVWCEPNSELVSGEYVMVKTNDGRSMVKELLYANCSEISLMSLNADFGRLTLPINDVLQAHYVGGIVPPSKVKM